MFQIEKNVPLVNANAKSEVVKDMKTLKLSYKNIKSDDYTLIIIEDENRNGIKDVSNYWLKRYLG